MEEPQVTFSVTIPRRLHDELQARIEESDFKDLSEYTAFVLAELAEAEDAPDSIETEDDAQTLERLRALGYVE